MQRVCVVGSGGAGKSTLAAKLGTVLGIEVIHLDALFWKPGWVQTPDEEFDELVRQAIAGDRWVIDGNFGRTQPMRFAAADTIVFLDYSTWLCLYRVLARWIRHRGQVRPDMGPGCPESVDLEFLRWVTSFRRRSRPVMLKRLQELDGSKRVIHLRGPAEARKCICNLERNGSVPVIEQFGRLHQ